MDSGLLNTGQGLDRQRPAVHVKVFQAVCEEVGVRPLTMIEYHLQGNGEVERFNAAIVSRPPHHIAEQQQDRASYVLPLKYAYITQVHWTNKLPPFNIVFSRQPAGHDTPAQSPIPPDAKHMDWAMALRILLIRWPAGPKRMADNIYGRKTRIQTWPRQEGPDRANICPGDCIFVKRPPLTTAAVK